MARITHNGTFIYCKGNIILDGWQVDCEGGEVLTQPEVMKLVLQWLTATMVEIPELNAKLESLKTIQRVQGPASKGAPDA